MKTHFKSNITEEEFFLNQDTIKPKITQPALSIEEIRWLEQILDKKIIFNNLEIKQKVRNKK